MLRSDGKQYLARSTLRSENTDDNIKAWSPYGCRDRRTCMRPCSKQDFTAVSIPITSKINMCYHYSDMETKQYLNRLTNISQTCVRSAILCACKVAKQKHFYLN